MRPLLVVIDLDETLIDRDLTISRANKHAIERVRRIGTKVTLATGRTYTTAEPFMRDLAITLPIICYQGAVIRTSRKVIRTKSLHPELVQPTIRFGFRERTQVAVYTEEHVFFNKPLSHWGKEYLNTIEQVREVSLVDLQRFRFPGKVLKVMCIGYNRKMVGVEQRARLRFRPAVTVTRSRPNLLEFTHPYANKGYAVRFLANRLGIPLRRVMAIGDGYNDVSMFQVAGFGVAVANAPKIVEEAADAVTVSEKDNGVAEALHAFILDRRRSPASSQ